MSEQYQSISKVRQQLPALSQKASTHMQRYVITNQGEPQSVLLGYADYQAMKAAVELATRLDVLARVNEGAAQMRRGESLTAEQMLDNIRRRSEGRAENPTVAAM